MTKIADRVKEQTTTVGTGTYSLDGAITAYQTFVSGVGDGNECHYTATDGTDWEVGVGTVTNSSPDTLTRDTIFSSSNSGLAVDWSAGNKNIFVVNSAEHIAGTTHLYINNISNAQDATAETTVDAGVDTTLKLTGSGSNNFTTFNVGTGKLELDAAFDGGNGGVIIDQLAAQTELTFRLSLVNLGGSSSAVVKIFLMDDKTVPGTGFPINSFPITFNTGVEVPIEFSSYKKDVEAIKVQINSSNSRTYRVNGLKVVAYEIVMEE
jgi:hypothetical protein